MSGSFTGFSEEDIRHLNHKRTREVQKHEGHKSALQGKRNNDRTKKRAVGNHVLLENIIKNSDNNAIPESAKLCQIPNVECINLIKNTEEVPVTEQQQECIKVQDVMSIELNNEVEDKTEKNHIHNPERKLDLAQFQERQKLIEEQNRKRKEILVKALAVRTQQTKEEAQKLEGIRNEFRKLDVLLSTDVKILRHEIEIASLEYMEAEKKYYRIEKEFLNAKLALHQKLERKEMLTEHLCTVIEKNEERKAEKLNDLLNKLNLTTELPSIDRTTEIDAALKTSDDADSEKVPQ